MGEAVAVGWCGGEEEPVRAGETPSAAREGTTPDEGVVVLALSSGMTNRGLGGGVESGGGSACALQHSGTGEGEGTGTVGRAVFLWRRRRRHSEPDIFIERGDDETRKEGESPGREGR